MSPRWWRLDYRAALAAVAVLLLSVVSGVDASTERRPLAGAVVSPASYVVTTFTLQGYTGETFTQPQVDALLDTLSNRLAVSASSLSITGFSPGPIAPSLSLQVQTATTETEQATVTSVLDAFLGSTETATDAFKAASLSATTGVVLTAAPHASSTQLHALFARSVPPPAVNSSVRFAMIGVFASVGVAFVALSIMACCMAGRRASSARPQVVAVGARGRAWRSGSHGVGYTC
jgi:hypothetical protein